MIIPCVNVYFNSHPHEEDDNGDALIISTIVYFNSHPHEEDDLKVAKHTRNCVYFNSHPHEEDDGTMSLLAQLRDISTHILTKRMTNAPTPSSSRIYISTHILTKRMTVSF